MRSEVSGGRRKGGRVWKGELRICKMARAAANVLGCVVHQIGKERLILVGQVQLHLSMPLTLQ